MVLAGRKINDNMSKWLGEQLILEMTKRKIKIFKSNILILGFTFKENCTDIRNTKVFDLIKILKEYELNIEIVDPWVNPKEASNFYGVNVKQKIPKNIKYDAVICAVAHQNFTKIKKSQWQNFVNQTGFIFDLKGIVPSEVNAIRI